MKTSLSKLACGLALLGAAASATAAGIPLLNLTLQDAGNGQTTFSISASSYFIGSGAGVSSSISDTGISELAPVFSGWINNLGDNTSPIALTGFGSFTNPNGASEGGTSSAQLDAIQFVADGGSTYSLDLNLASTLGIGPGDRMFYSPATDTGVIDVPFSDFKPGSYNYTETAGSGPFSQNINFDLTVVQPVPEPSTLALAGLGGLATLLYRRRK
jgi:hypothetical protein